MEAFLSTEFQLPTLDGDSVTHELDSKNPYGCWDLGF